MKTQATPPVTVKRITPHEVVADPITQVVRVDGIPLFSIWTDERAGLMVRVKDPIKARSDYRKAEFVDIPLCEFLARLNDICQAIE